MLHSSEIEELQLSIQLGTLRKDVMKDKRLMEVAMLFIEQSLGDGEFSITRLEELQDEADTTKTDLEGTERRCEQLEREARSMEDQIRDLERKIERLEDENESLEKEVESLRKAEAA